MARIIIVGDGPGGLSAALFLARGGHDVTVHGLDKTSLHYAYLNNYLGIREIDGSEFQRIARRQVEAAGARIVAEEVTAVSLDGGIRVTTDSGASEADYLIFTEGKNPKLATEAGLETDENGAIVVDSQNRSSVDRVYAVGRSVRPRRSQAIISAGAGAVAALDILAAEEGKDVQDWDTPPKE